MIVHHQNNIAGFAGNHTVYARWFITRRIMAPSIIRVGSAVNLARIRIADLMLANPLYAGALVRVFGLNFDGSRNPDYLPTLYEKAEGDRVAANPQTLDAAGKFARPVYAEQPFALEIRRRYQAEHDTAGRRPASVLSGAGSPEGVVSASIGTVWLRTDGGTGSTAYVKESGSGNTGWVAK